MTLAKHRLVFVLLVVMIGCNSRKVNIDEEQAIKDTLTEMWDAIEKEDIERYASYVHDDYTQFGETDPTLKSGTKSMPLPNGSKIHKISIRK